MEIRAAGCCCMGIVDVRGAFYYGLIGAAER
jgi:hypothetical protein